MFLAGLKTVQISTTNLVHRMLTNPEICEKLMSEIRPPLDACKGQIQEKFTYDTAMEFDLLQRCYWEAIRLEPPAPVTFFQCFSRDVTIGPNKVKIAKDVDIQMSIDALCVDPSQWIEPHKYEPERFNLLGGDQKWLKTPSGQMRSPLAFTPFFGGKRICLGKSFAEVSTRFTIPILFHYMELRLADPKHAKSKYTVGGLEEAKIPLKFKVRNPVN